MSSGSLKVLLFAAALLLADTRIGPRTCASAPIPTICRSQTNAREGFENQIVELIAHRTRC